MNICRRFRENIWVIKLVIDISRKEIEVQEKFVLVSDLYSYSVEGFSGANLLAWKGNFSKLACVFSNKANQFSHKCRIFSKPQAKKEMVMQKKFCLFFLCLKAGNAKEILFFMFKSQS